MILYIIYDSDLVRTAEGKQELTLAFIDDTAFLAIGKDFQDMHKILNDMLERSGGGFEWSSQHNSRFAPSKFALIDFSMNRTRDCPPLIIRGATITPSPFHIPGPLLVQRILHNSLLHISTLPNHHPLNAITTRIAKRGPVKCHKTALHHLLQNLAVNPLTMEVTHPRPVHPISTTPFNTSIATSKEAAIADFYCCINRMMIFTNSSSTSSKVRAAPSFYIDFTHIATLWYHLGKDTEHTVFEAEAVGLILAARLLQSRNEATFPATIFVDNQAVIRSGAHPTAKPGHYLLLHFRKLVCHLQDEKDLENASINLNWIAGHADIEGNELADREAKLAALKKDKASPCRELPKLLRHPLPFSTSAVKQAHEDSLQKRWREEWQGSPRYPHIRALDLKHTPRSFLKLTGHLRKKHTAIYVQLHTGHALLNKHLNCIKKSDTASCLQCADDQTETIHHYMFDCPRYNRERHILQQKLGHNTHSTAYLLSDKTTQQALFRFIDSTKCLHATFGDIPTPPKDDN